MLFFLALGRRGAKSTSLLLRLLFCRLDQLAFAVEHRNRRLEVVLVNVAAGLDILAQLREEVVLLENELLARRLLRVLRRDAELALRLHCLCHVQRLLHEARRLDEQATRVQAEVRNLAFFLRLFLQLDRFASVLALELI